MGYIYGTEIIPSAIVKYWKYDIFYMLDVDLTFDVLKLTVASNKRDAWRNSSFSNSLLPDISTVKHGCACFGWLDHGGGVDWFLSFRS